MATGDPGIAIVEFDERVFSIDCVKRAAYSFSDQFAADIEVRDGRVRCALHFNGRPSAEDITKAVNRLRVAIVDYDLRERIRKETEPMRATVLAYAYSKTNLASSD